MRQGRKEGRKERRKERRKEERKKDGMRLMARLKRVDGWMGGWMDGWIGWMDLMNVMPLVWGKATFPKRYSSLAVFLLVLFAPMAFDLHLREGIFSTPAFPPSSMGGKMPTDQTKQTRYLMGTGRGDEM